MRAIDDLFDQLGRVGQPERGAAIVEFLLTAVLITILAAVMSHVTTLMLAMQARSDVQSSLHAHALRAMRTIITDLQQSSFRTVGVKDFPYVFDDGVADAPFSSHSHTPASSEAVTGDPDFGPNREIVFVRPADVDNDGRPDLSGSVVDWSPDEISYTVVTTPSGNRLMRSVNNANPVPLARHIERIVFDTPTSSGFTIPLGTLRVQLFLRARDKHGTVHRFATETTVRLQFGDT